MLAASGSACNAQVAELVDAPDLGSGAARRGGSSPFLGTMDVWMAFERKSSGLGAIDDLMQIRLVYQT